MSRCKEILILVCCLFAAVGGGFLTAPSSLAATYYVSPGGNDANPGTLAAPFRTITTGVLALRPGDILQIRGGVYAESLLGTIPGGTSWTTPVTISAYTGEQVTLKPPYGATRVIEINGENRQYIIIDGLILDGANVLYDVFKIGGNGTIGVAHHIRLQNSEVKNSPGPGIVVDGTFWPGFSNVPGCCNEFINLNVHDNGTTENNQGFYIRSGGNLVKNSKIYRNKCCGINAFVSGGSQPNDNFIVGNEVFDNGINNVKGDGILVGGYRANVQNNIVYNNRTVGIYVFGGDQRDAKILNNTIYNNIGVGIWVDPGSRNTSLINNIIYGSIGAPIQDTGVETFTATNLTIDPLFVDAVGKNFRLQSGSQGINTGTALPEVPRDHAGTTRPQGGNYDIGAYEQGAGIVDTVPPATPRNVNVY